MTSLSILQTAPLLTVIVWLGLVVYLVARDRFRTWTEVFFLATCFFVGAYALSDFTFFNASTVLAAEDAARCSFTFLSFAATFFLLFAVVLHGRMHRSLFLLILPTLGALILVWTRLVVGAVSAADVGLPYRAVYDVPSLSVWAVYALLYAIPGLGVFWRTLAEVKRIAPALGRQMQLELVALFLVAILGASTNLPAALLGLHAPPLFSTLLVLPGVLAVVALQPLQETRLVAALHRWKARTYDIKAAFLTFEDGTLLGAQVQRGEATVDGDLFGSTLEVIQDFMRTSFPMLQGKWLRSITHGGYTLVMERGRITHLTVVLQGTENDQLRRVMRDALRSYERANRDAFAHWRGDATEAAGTEAMLSTLLEG